MMTGIDVIKGIAKVVVMAVLAIVVVGGAFVSGYAACWFRTPDVQYPVGDAPEVHRERFRVFWEAWHLIEEEFQSNEPLDPQQMTYGAITGMVESLKDPHTVWVDPTKAAILQEDLSGSFQGIGATVNMINGFLTIVKPLPGSPAERAGIKPGDIILEADGQPIKNMDVLDAVSLIRGPEGTTVRLLVRRQGEEETAEFEVIIERAKLELPTLEAKLIPAVPGGQVNIAYLKLNEFNGRAASEVRQALLELQQRKPIGIILDLRNNPGGLLHSAIEISSQFIAQGVIVRERNNKGKEIEYTARRGGLATDEPLVVLVNAFSASASEIVAGAIQDHARGLLIGETTFGKGSMQTPYTLSDQSSLILTTARWYTPKDRQIDGQGLQPDIEVVITDEDLRMGRDPQLERATEHLLLQTQ